MANKNPTYPVQEFNSEPTACWSTALPLSYPAQKHIDKQLSRVDVT